MLLSVVYHLTVGLASAVSISVNFSENDGNQVFVGNQNIGPLATNSSFWNNTSPEGNRTGTLEAGTLVNPLIDSNGNVTTATITWSASNPWYNDDGTGNDEQKMAVGYLDDGGSGVSIIISNVPYALYRVYGLLASDQGEGTTYTTLDFTVNGTDVLGGTATAYKTMIASNSAEGANWTLLSTSDVGNYWLSGITSGSTLTINGALRSGDDRGSISAIIIEQIPEPSTGLLGGLGVLALLRRRRH